MGLNGALVHLLEEYVYPLPEPPPRVRTKPMQVICPGLSRSGTESLQQALLTLGYDHTYHGWDILFEDPPYVQGWTRLAKRKWAGTADGAPDGECEISAAEFDALLGHSVAVTDTAANFFAAELIKAYPDALVVLNKRRDLGAWHRSVDKNLLKGVADSWAQWGVSRFSAKLWWGRYLHCDIIWPAMFRCEGNMGHGLLKNGKWIYREHCAMVRGLVPADRLLEWSVEDGWEPLCKFLNKPVPKIPFPRTNDAVGMENKKNAYIKDCFRTAIVNLSITVAVLVGVGAVGWRLRASYQ